MRTALKALSTAASAIAIAGVLAAAPLSSAVAADAAAMEEGKKLAFDRKKGNCLACHMITGGDLPGNIGPPLIAMKARFPDKDKLRAQIADPRTANPHTMMPPFIPHGVITEAELDKIVDFVHSL